MKKKLSALLLSAVLCVTAIPVTGMAAEFSDGSAVETLGEDVRKAFQLKPVSPGKVNLTPKLIRFKK